MPSAQCNQMSGMTLIALCRLTRGGAWSNASRSGCTVTKGIMDHLKKHYGANYAPNTREIFRRHVLHQFVQGGIADRNPFEPDLPTNSPRTHYAVTEAALAVIHLHGTTAWDGAVERFRREQGALADIGGVPRFQAFVALPRRQRATGDRGLRASRWAAVL